MAEPEIARPDGHDESIEPLLYPCNIIAPSAPLRWLRKGWADLKAAPAQSLTYGSVLVLLGWLLTWLAWQGGNTVALFTLVTGLILVGPALAFGTYSISRQLEMGKKPRLGFCLRDSKTHMRNELLYALILLIILLVWARAASMVHVFFPVGEELGWAGWLQFLAVGSVVGSFFAAIVFTSAAFSLPMMLDRGTDAVTSTLTSVNAVLNNKRAMLVWGALIVGLVLLGLATAYIGLAVVVPLIGHATWHGYKEVVKPAA